MLMPMLMSSMMRIHRSLLLDLLSLPHLARKREITLAELVRALHAEEHLRAVRVLIAVLAFLEVGGKGTQIARVRAQRVLAILVRGVPGVRWAGGCEVVAASDGGAGVFRVRPPAPGDGTGHCGAEAVDEREVAVVEIGVAFAGREVALYARVARSAFCCGFGGADADPARAGAEAVRLVVDLAFAVEVAVRFPSVGVVACKLYAVVAVAEDKERNEKECEPKGWGLWVEPHRE